MIEVIYKDEKKESQDGEELFSIPRNIRQIGLISENYRIYMEDYVYTFLGRMAETCREAGDACGCAAVLLGDTKWADGTAYVFARGALAVKEMEVSAEHIDFTEDIWKDIQEEQEKYFRGEQVVGWFFTQKSLPVEITEAMKRAHLKHFGGADKVLMLMDAAEREDAFFRYDNGFMIKQSGYYLYYEKNPQMQAYMLEKHRDYKPEEQEQVSDEAVRTFRKIIRQKKTEKLPETEEKTSVFSYAATACLALAILAVSVNFYQNYRKLHTAGQQVLEEAAPLEETSAANAVPTEKAGGTPAAKKTTAASGETLTKVTPAPAAEEEEGSEKNDMEAEEAQREPETDGGLEEQASEETYSVESDVRKERFHNEETQEEDSDTEEPREQTVSQSEVSSSYVIRPGDTLYQICMEKYGNMDAITEICRLNGLSEEELIYPGQVIVLP